MAAAGAVENSIRPRVSARAMPAFSLRARIAFAALLVIVAVSLGLMMRAASFAQFDSARWYAAADGAAERASMADDLVQRHLMVGMPRARVIELLGAPDAEGLGCGDRTYTIYSYDLDATPNQIGRDVLSVTFCEGRVTSFKRSRR